MLTDSQRKTVEDNLALIGFTINKYYAGGQDLPIQREDLEQICSVHLCRAAQNYDPAKGEFSTFAVDYIKSAVAHYLRGLQQDKRKANNCALSLDMTYDRCSADKCDASIGAFLADPSTPVDEKVCIASAIRHCAKEYPTQAPLFNACLFKQMECKEAAKIIGVSKTTFTKHFSRYKTALAQALL